MSNGKDWKITSNPFHLMQNEMVKYRLSKNITVSGIDDQDENMPLQYRQGYYILSNETGNRDFLINETINYFITKFSESKTPNEVLEEIKRETGSDGPEIEETCSTFFKFLCKRKILVPDNEEEETPKEVKCLYNKGDNIDNWTILEVLVNKHSIDIYKALNRSTGVTCVIKLLYRNKIGDDSTYEKELAYLRREYRLLKKVKNLPSISNAYGFHKQGNEYAYISLEYIEGKSLSRFLRKSKRLTKKACLNLIEQILLAFSLLHQKSLIHGDIHSSNVLVTEDNTVRIIDLGLTRHAKTEKNEVLKFGGVDYYMPPERINLTSAKKYSKEPDLYSDVYQIGLLLYLVLYNTLPFAGFIWEELAKNIKEAEVAYPEQSFLKYKVPLSLTIIIKKCLNKNPGERYKNATKALEDFQKSGLKIKKKLIF